MKRILLAVLVIAIIAVSVWLIAGYTQPRSVPVTYPSINPADYAPGGSWEQGEPSPSYIP